jgi:hypothetical protein
VPHEERINTHWGEPRDGLEVSPTQLGLFDASFPLRRVAYAQTASPLLPEGWRWEGPFKGWAAVAPLFEQARWVPLLNGYDRYGRLRGALGAMLYHYDGPFLGSTWAFFGVTRDLWEGKSDSPSNVAGGYNILGSGTWLNPIPSSLRSPPERLITMGPSDAWVSPIPSSPPQNLTKNRNPLSAVDPNILGTLGKGRFMNPICGLGFAWRPNILLV